MCDKEEPDLSTRGFAGNTARCVVLVAVVGLLALGLAQPAMSQLKMDRSKECVICHVEWGDGYEKMAPLLPPVDHPILIDGKEARVSTQDMCWSCHDGYVGDSRAYFKQGNPHARKASNPHGTKGSGLPLDLNGEMYCGTCHTPHMNKMEREFMYIPFLREETENSALCLKCHSDHARRGTDHPIHASLESPLPEALAGRHVSATKVECLSCHNPHDPVSAKLMVEGDRTALCRSCHESSFAILESDHHLALSHPNLTIGNTGKTAGTADACAACHVSHGGKGASMWAWPLPNGRAADPVSSGVDARCLSCHQDKGAASAKTWVGHGHTMDATVKNAGNLLPLRSAQRMSCTTCHDPHQWSPQADGRPGPGGEEGDALSSFLRLPDDENGRLCVTCHTAEAQTLVSDHNSFNWKEPSRGQCTSCHNTHEKASFSDGHANGGVSEFTSLCLSCHEGQGRHGATPLGEHGHLLSVKLKAEDGLPGYRADNLRTWKPGADAPTGVDLLVGCESCHEPHHWRPAGAPSWTGPDAQGDDASSFLRLDNTGAQLCTACHKQEAHVLGSGHDLGERQPNQSACRACHTTHRAVSDWAIIASSLTNAQMDSVTRGFPATALERNPENWSPGARHCLSCHREQGLATRIPEAWGHPQKYLTVDGPWRPDGRSMPLFENQARALGPVGHVDCTSCHNPHVAQPPTGGESSPDFLRQETSEAVCSDCHGDKALWKHRYYHLSDKRILP